MDASEHRPLAEAHPLWAEAIYTHSSTLNKLLVVYDDVKVGLKERVHISVGIMYLGPI